jgi:hypothetical protein
MPLISKVEDPDHVGDTTYSGSLVVTQTFQSLRLLHSVCENMWDSTLASGEIMGGCGLRRARALRAVAIALALARRRLEAR